MSNQFIKYLGFRDVCIKVKHIREKSNGNLVGTGVFWNMGYDSSWSMRINTKFNIIPSEMKYWVTTSSKEKCIRNVKWFLLKP